LDSIAVDSTSLYWIDGTSLVVMKIPLDGGTPVTLAQGAGNPMLGACRAKADPLRRAESSFEGSDAAPLEHPSGRGSRVARGVGPGGA
jgi:hypothetical protein